MGKHHHRVACAGVFSGLILLAIGTLCWYKSSQYEQVRIVYDRNGSKKSSLTESLWLRFPLGTRSDEVRYASCTPTATPGEEMCRVNVTFPRGMAHPLLLYNIGPFYQNYNAYLKSEVIEELMGQEVPDSLRQKRCVEPTRVRRVGPNASKDIVPCGMKATSFFNDTFSVVGVDIDFSNIAWVSDIERFHNPKDYNSAGKLWLPDLYPGVVPRDLGVNDQAFATWMRPSAVPRVWNRYGAFNQDFKPGSSIEVIITSRFPMKSIAGSFKEMVITEHGLFGARHDGFGIFATIAGVVCILMAFAAYIVDRLCSRRFHGSDHGSTSDSSTDREDCIELPAVP